MNSEGTTDPFANRTGQDYHLGTGSPCIDVGSNDYAQPGIPDMDGQRRVQNETIDIGADEVAAGCAWYTISLSAPVGGHIGSEVIITGIVTEPPDRPISNWPVTITVTGGTLVSVVNGVVDSQTTGHTKTDQYGRFTFVVTQDTPADITVTAESPNACGTGQITKSANITFFDPAVPVEMFFCIDVTGSMLAHFPFGDVADLLADMADRGISFRAGAVQFNPCGEWCGDTTDGWLFRSLNDFTDLGTFIGPESGLDWRLFRGPMWPGGDAPELQLDALQAAAADMNDYSTSGNIRRYIVLITDHEYHYSTDGLCQPPSSELAEADVRDQLAATRCKVYISLFPTPMTPPIPKLDDWYRDLLVNGGQFDPYDVQTGNYPFTNLRATLLSLY